MKLRCMIVDDEPGAVNLLEVLIGQSTDWLLVSKCYNALEAVAFLKSDEVDVVFMDINMPLINGMELAALLPPKKAIVFTTAHSEYAVDSYTFNTIDYLLKPITLKRFLVTVQKVEQHFEAYGAGGASAGGPGAAAGGGPGAAAGGGPVAAVSSGERAHGGYFFIKSGTEHRKILLNEILFFESRKEYVRVVTVSFEVLTYRRLKDIEAQLPLPFTRVHQSFIVNLQQLVKIQDNHIHIGDTRIPIGDKFRDGLMELVRKRTF